MVACGPLPQAGTRGQPLITPGRREGGREDDGVPHLPGEGLPLNRKCRAGLNWHADSIHQQWKRELKSEGNSS